MKKELMHAPIFLAGKSAIAGKEDLRTAQDLLDTLIAHKADVYVTEEGCLSLLGGPRPCKRYQRIKVRYQTTELQTRIKTYTGFTAQIIRHEVDHCDGVLI